MKFPVAVEPDGHHVIKNIWLSVAVRFTSA
jgi:hypothetical protein